jgi:hypothetical protein
MNKFMVEMDLPSPLTVDFVSQIPAQQYAVEKLMTAGLIVSYSLSLEHSKLWIIMIADTDDELAKLLGTLPLTPFMKSKWYALAFSNIGTFHMPQMILN